MAKKKTSTSHRHRKFNRYTGDTSRRRKRRSVGLWWLIPTSALAAFILALILGNCLGQRVEPTGDASSPESREETSSLPPAISSGANAVDGVFVGLEGIRDYTYDEVAKQIPSDTKAISLSMFYSNRAPIYFSEVAEIYGKPSGELTLRNIFRYPLENGIYVSVPFPSEALSDSTSASAPYEAELIKELYDAGANDIILKCNYETLDEALVARVAEYIIGLKESIPDICIGFAVSVKDAEKTAEIDKLLDYADFCAVDMSSAQSGDELTALTSPLLTNILRYNMRVMLRGGDEASLAERYAVLDNLGIKNRQVISK
jgi:hypothetical protein